MCETRLYCMFKIKKTNLARKFMILVIPILKLHPTKNKTIFKLYIHHGNFIHKKKKDKGNAN